MVNLISMKASKSHTSVDNVLVCEQVTVILLDAKVWFEPLEENKLQASCGRKP